MKKIFEIPELEVVRFVEADIVVCSGCTQEWECESYGIHGGCTGDCDAFCALYTLNPDLDGEYPGTGTTEACPNYCSAWRSDCEGYNSGAYYPSCSSLYSYTEPWVDGYGTSYGASWTFEENSSYYCPRDSTIQ